MAYDFKEYHRARQRRKRVVRPHTLNAKRITKREREIERVTLNVLGIGCDHERPQTRGDCVDGIRPCPFVGCKYHLYSDVHPETGSLKLNFPDLEPIELAETCALDVAERGGTTLEAVAELMNVTRERVRQIEVVAKAKMRATALRATLRAHTEAHGELREDDDVVVVPRELGDHDKTDLETFADLLLTQTPPGEREP